MLFELFELVSLQVGTLLGKRKAYFKVFCVMCNYVKVTRELHLLYNPKLTDKYTVFFTEGIFTYLPKHREIPTFFRLL